MLKGGVSADEFLRSSGLAKILEDIMVGCCREKPDKLAPYVVDYLNVRAAPLHAYHTHHGQPMQHASTHPFLARMPQGNYSNSAK